jgi:hypothetical protein
MRLNIRGEEWDLRFKKPPGSEEDRGLCDKDTRTIHVEPDDDILGTLLHETLHALYWDLDEAAIIEGEVALLESLRALDKYLRRKTELQKRSGRGTLD